MSERKAINKWYPPDWDPLKAPKGKKKTNPNAEKVRLMLPFSMKCLSCNEYIAARRKFNARKEITAERYMGIKIIKFHIKCPRCNNGIIFQTDPKLAGFIPVEGGARNYEKLSTKGEAKPMETEDEIFARLEREDEENQKFQELKNKRKNNPFWQSQQKKTDKDAMANLEEKLIEQQKEQEIHDHLSYLQAKAEKLQKSGGSDVVASAIKKDIQKRQLESDNEADDVEVNKLFEKKTANDETSQSALGKAESKGVSGIITVKRLRRALPGRSQENIQKSGNATETESNIEGEKKEVSENIEADTVGSESALAGLAGYSSDLE